MSKDLRQFTNDFRELERVAQLGYADPTVMMNINKFSRAVLSNGVVSLISSFNNLNPFLDTPTELFIASTSADDTMTMRLKVINQLREMVDIDVTLNGTTPVSLGSDIYCIWRMYNTGTADNVGTIVATSNATGTPVNDTEVFCKIGIINNIPDNQSLTSIFSIPAGWTGFLYHADIQTDKGADVKGAMFSREQGSVFRFSKALASFEAQSDYDNIFVRLNEKTDIKPYGFAQTGGITYVNYSLLLIKNEYLDKHKYL